jgi:hypothetical protein
VTIGRVVTEQDLRSFVQAEIRRTVGQTAPMLRGDGSPEGIVFADFGVIWQQADSPGATFKKTTGIASNTGWVSL